jgi:hypothetical protein
VIGNLLDRIEVYGTGNRKLVKLRVVLKIADDSMDYEVKRVKGKPSLVTAVCESYKSDFCSIPTL